MDPRRRLRGLPTDVYRAYDSDGRLLYVGMSVNVFQRLKQHRYEAPWYSQVSSVRVEQYKDWRTARHVEGYAIKHEHPQWNVMSTWHNGSTPEPIEVFEIDASEFGAW